MTLLREAAWTGEGYDIGIKSATRREDNVLRAFPPSLGRRGGAGSFGPARPKQPHRPDHAVLRLQDFHRRIGDFHRYARFGDVLQVLEDQTVQGLGPIEGQREAKLAVEFPQLRGALDQGAPVLPPPERGGARRCSGGELDDNLLDDVLQRDQTLEFAVFIHDQRDALVVLLEIMQLREHRGGGGNEVRLVEQRFDARAVDLVPLRQMQNLAQMQNADYRARFAPVHGQPGVIGGGELLVDGLDRRVDVDRLDARPWRHDVLDGDPLQVEQVDEDALVLLRHELRRFEYDHAQLLRRKARRLGAAPAHAEHERQRRDEQVHKPDYRVQHPKQRLEHVCDERRDALGVGGTDHLWGNLGEHEDQERDHQRAAGEHDFLVAEQLDGDHPDQRCGRGIDQIVAEQNHAQQLVGLGEQVRGDLRAAAAQAHEIAS